jgi:hypothetical protein
MVISRLQPLVAGLSSAVVAAALLLAPANPAEAVLNSPNAQIARSVDAALRRSIPAFNPEVKAIQKSLEDVAYLLRIPQRKPFGNMAADVDEALAKFDNRQQLLEGVPAASLPQVCHQHDVPFIIRHPLAST